MRRIFFLLVSVLLAVSTSVAQLKTLQAIEVKISPKLDGLLDEAAWTNAPIAADFITNSPVYGETSIVKTEVRVVYDNTAIYIGAYLHDNPSLIRKQMTSRDGEQRQDVDYFSVFFDTYLDKQSGFQFLVTSRNVQTDARLSPNAPATGFGIYGDLSWDAVWDSRVNMMPDGWIVEMKIPYSAVRFSKKSLQEWGIQFLRFTRRQNETAFWNPVDPNVNGFVNQFGILTGLQNLVPPLRLSFSPYVSGGYRSTPELSGENHTEWLKSGGMDVKYGISESFTLDMTLIPDFGQVISDNLVNNITPYEVKFTENRPFFTEGTELFNKAGIFYSRRIGKTPTGYSNVQYETEAGSLQDFDIVRNPSVTRLYNAVKFSGRTKDKLGIGIFNAVTEEVHAKIKNRYTGRDTFLTTEPLVNYNIIVIDQVLKNRSYVTLTNTNVIREGKERDANVTAINLALYDRSNTFGLFLRPKYSKIFGETPYDGLANYFEVGKVSGKFQYSIANNIESDQYDINDLGILPSPNEVTNQANFSYNIFHPTKRFLNQRYSIELLQSYLYKDFHYQTTEISTSAFWLFKNFWDISFSSKIGPRWYNDFFELQTPSNPRETPRRMLKRAPYYFFGVDGSSDSRKRFFGRYELGFAEGPLPKDPYLLLHFGGRYRFSDRFTFDLDVQRQHDNGQYGLLYDEYGPVFDGSEPVLSRREYTDIATILTGSYNFTPRMNLSLRARHYWNKLANTNLYNVKSDGNWTERFDLIPSDFNVNYNTFSLDVFYIWDFRLGSRIILGYKNWLGRDFEYLIDGTKYQKYPVNLEQTFNQPHGNEFTVRFIYYLDYLQLRKAPKR